MFETIELEHPFTGTGEVNENRTVILINGRELIAYDRYLECVKAGRWLSMAEYDQILRNKQDCQSQAEGLEYLTDSPSPSN